MQRIAVVSPCCRSRSAYQDRKDCDCHRHF
jgi:hypothetical protein